MAKKQTKTEETNTEPVEKAQPNITFSEVNGVVYATFVDGDYTARGMGETVKEALIDLPKAMKDYV